MGFLKNGIMFIGATILLVSIPAQANVVHSNWLTDKEGQASIQELRRGVEANTPAPSLDQTIEEWLITMAEQPGFSHWKDAKWQRSPLGPGQHGWIIILEEEGEELGYLIVTATPEGELVVTEYGVGEYPLFSLKTLEQALQQYAIALYPFEAKQLVESNINRQYVSPTEAVWEIAWEDTRYILDGKTGEPYPIEDMTKSSEETWSLEGTSEAVASPDGSFLSLPHEDGERLKIDFSLSRTAFDPFDHLSWLVSSAVSPVTFDQMVEAFQDSARITYVSHILNEKVTHAFAVVGVQVWNNGSVFIELDHFGSRHIPMETLLAVGSFHIARLE